MSNIGLILDAETITDLVDLAKRAEDAGLDSVWTTELYRTAFGQIAPIAQATRSIKLGTAVSLAFVRSPLVTALTSFDIDETSGGRFILGLGSGAKRANESWHGIEYGKPVPKIKECMDVIRLIMSKCHRGEPISYDGEYYDIEIKGYKRPFKPVRERVPIYLAGIGKYMTKAAGEVADGYLGHVVCSHEYLKQVVSRSIKDGLEKAGRDREDLKVASIITCAPSADKKRAMRAARATIALYATVRTYEPPFKLHGFLEECQKIRDAYFKKDIEAMIENVSDEMVEAFAVVGSADKCRKKIEEYREYIDLPILSAPHYFLDFEEVKEYQRGILEVFGG